MFDRKQTEALTTKEWFDGLKAGDRVWFEAGGVRTYGYPAEVVGRTPTTVAVGTQKFRWSFGYGEQSPKVSGGFGTSARIYALAPEAARLHDDVTRITGLERSLRDLHETIRRFSHDASDSVERWRATDEIDRRRGVLDAIAIEIAQLKDRVAALTAPTNKPKS